MPRRIAIDFGARRENKRNDDAHRENEIYRRVIHDANQLDSL